MSGYFFFVLVQIKSMIHRINKQNEKADKKEMQGLCPLHPRQLF